MACRSIEYRISIEYNYGAMTSYFSPTLAASRSLYEDTQFRYVSHYQLSIDALGDARLSDNKIVAAGKRDN